MTDLPEWPKYCIYVNPTTRAALESSELFLKTIEQKGIEMSDYEIIERDDVPPGEGYIVDREEKL